MSWEYRENCSCKHCEDIREERFFKSMAEKGYTWKGTPTGKTEWRKSFWRRKPVLYKEVKKIKINDFGMVYCTEEWVKDNVASS